METTIDALGVHLKLEKTDLEKMNEIQKIKFLVLKYLLGSTGKFRLGFAWIFLEPILVSLIYVFLFSVIRSDISGELIIIGIGAYGVFSNSFKAGISGIAIKNGGFTAERVRTSTIVKSQIILSIIEGILQGGSILLLMAIAMDIVFPNAFSFIIICASISVLSRMLGFNLVMIVAKTPDVKHVFDFILRLGFFVTPVLYPIDSCVGLHLQFNRYNPMSYVIEMSRYHSGVIDYLHNPNEPIQIIMATFLLILCFRGVKKLDKYRWETSTWN